MKTATQQKRLEATHDAHSRLRQARRLVFEETEFLEPLLVAVQRSQERLKQKQQSVQTLQKEFDKAFRATYTRTGKLRP